MSARWLLMCALSCATAACKEGDVDFDGSVFDDVDAATKSDAGGGSDDDAGSEGDAAIDAAQADPDAGGSTLTAAQVPAALASAFCNGLVACRGEWLVADSLKGEDCVERQTSEKADGELHFLQDSISAGRIVFEPASFAACADDIEAFACDAPARRLPASCEVALHGQVASGGDCNLDLDCEGAAFCMRTTPDTCPGTCTALRAAGGGCTASDECEDGLRCYGGKCAVPGGEGDDCSAGMPQCGFGFVCRTEGADSICRSVSSVYSAGEGEACSPSTTLCAGSLVCASTSASAGECEPHVSAGAACRRASPNQCPRDQYCDADPGMMGTCVDFPAASEPCLAGRSQVCAAGFVCIADFCQPIGRAGDACTDDAECYSGTCLDPGTGAEICVTPVSCDGF